MEDICIDDCFFGYDVMIGGDMVVFDVVGGGYDYLIEFFSEIVISDCVFMVNFIGRVCSILW